MCLSLDLLNLMKYENLLKHFIFLNFAYILISGIAGGTTERDDRSGCEPVWGDIRASGVQKGQQFREQNF